MESIVTDRADSLSSSPSERESDRYGITVPTADPIRQTYNRVGYLLFYSSIAWSFLGLGLMVRLRVGPRLRDIAEKRTRFRFLRAALFYGLYSLLLLFWAMPIRLYGHFFERSYGFATQSLGLWFLDQGRGWFFGLLTGALAVWVGYWLLERSPKRWWLWLWALSIPAMLTQYVLEPVVVAPFYNRFVPLKNTELRDKLLALAAKAHISGAKVYEVDSSRRTTRINAYVTGIGPTKRIVLWDTTLHTLSDDEILAVMGHEMGHYVLGHVWWDLGSGVIGAFALLWLLSRLLPWAVARFGPRAGLRSVHDMAGLPLAMFLLSALLFLQSPIASAFSRYQEHQADRFSLQLTHLNVPLARVFVKFVTRDFDDPDPPPFYVFWFSTHPPVRERVAFALSYRPER